MPVFIDVETRSVINLRREGLRKYTLHPSTDLYCMSVAYDNEPAELIWFKGGRALPAERVDRLLAAVRDGAEIVAHNAAFEYAIWQDILVKRYGFPKLVLEQLTCTMAAAYAMALPGNLNDACAAVGLPGAKDDIGHQLMLRMCKPSNMSDIKKGKATEPKWPGESGPFTFLGERITLKQALRRLGRYCATDVEAERMLFKRVRPLSARERHLWCVDQRINRRGIAFDMEAVNAARALRDTAKERIGETMKRASGGRVAAGSALPALKQYLADCGLIADSLAKFDIIDLLARDDLRDDMRELLESRQEFARTTSISKLDAVHRQAVDGRVCYQFQYHSANTGRWAGRAVQPHNFTRDLPKPQRALKIMQYIREGNDEALRMLYGSPITAISMMLRAFIIAGPGRMLVGGDWSNVEGRGLAWLAGEEWKLKAFRDFDAGTGPDIYCLTYAEMFNMTVEEVTEHLRQIGKVIELSMGYQGGVGAFQSMAGNYGVSVPDEQADAFKFAWRDLHPAVVQFWYDIEAAAKRAVWEPGKVFPAGAGGREVKFRKVGSFLWCLLPSGRALCYPYPQVLKGERGPVLTYKRVPTPEDRKRKRIIPDPSNTTNWARIGTYGGMLTENVTQAVCRDVLAESLVRLEDAGYAPVLHVHDEPVVEGHLTEDDRQRVERILLTQPDWAPDLPLAASCWLSDRYIKD